MHARTDLESQAPWRIALRQGHEHLDEGNRSAAERCFEQAYTLAPHRAETAFALGRERRYAGRLDDAERLLGAAHEAAPSIAPPAAELARCIGMNGKRAREAHAVLDRAIAAGASAATIELTRAELLMAAGRVEDAIAAAEKAHSLPQGRRRASAMLTWLRALQVDDTPSVAGPKDDPTPAVGNVRVSLAVRSTSLTPDAISAHLGCDADSVRSDPSLRFPHHWKLHSGLPLSASLDEQLRSLVKRCSGMETRIAAVSHQAGTHATVAVVVEVASEDAVPGLWIPREVVTFLAASGLDIDVDAYFTVEDTQ